MACTDVVEKERSSLGFAFVMLLLAYVIITAVATAEALFIVLALSRRSILPQLHATITTTTASYLHGLSRQDLDVFERFVQFVDLGRLDLRHHLYGHAVVVVVESV